MRIDINLSIHRENWKRFIYKNLSRECVILIKIEWEKEKTNAFSFYPNQNLFV